MTGSRRLSQAISEGDGISLLVEVTRGEDARTAEEQGAEGIVVTAELEGVRAATTLPILWCASGPLERAREAGADACLLVAAQLEDEEELERRHARALELGLESVIGVRDEEELRSALGRVDPEIVVLGSRDGALERALELLADVPAGKLAIAEADVTGRDDVAELERAGFDAVFVRGGDVAELVRGAASAT